MPAAEPRRNASPLVAAPAFVTSLALAVVAGVLIAMLLRIFV
jgi:hypothetical protein